MNAPEVEVLAPAALLDAARHSTRHAEAAT